MNYDLYWRLRYRMYKAVKKNILHIGELEPLTEEAIRVWNFLFPDEPIDKELI